MITLTFGLLVSVAVVMCGYAQPKVGPLDGKRVENLPALPTPLGVAEEKITDTTFAQRMEDNGDWVTALYEWQKIADESPAWAQAKALHRVALAQQKLGNGSAAAQTYRRIVALAQTDDAKAEAYYHLLQLADATESDGVLLDVVALQPQTAAAQAWKNATLYHSVWHQAQGGSITATYNLPQALELQARVQRMDADLAGRRIMAERYGLLPGLGHAYLGRPQSAAAILPVWALFGWAMFYAFRRRQWPYGLIWALAFFSIWASGPAQARKLAETMNADTRLAALNNWEDLMPRLPTAAEQMGPEVLSSPEPIAVESIPVSPSLTPSSSVTVLASPAIVPVTSATMAVEVREDGKLQAVAATSTQPVSPSLPSVKPKPKPKPQPAAKPKTQAEVPAASSAPAAWQEAPLPSYFSIRPAP